LNSRIGTFSPNHSRRNRTSKDKTVNAKGKQLIETIKSSDLVVVNGCTKSDKGGEYTFMNRNGSSCIDLCFVSANIQDNVDLEVLTFEGSSHFPIYFTLNPFMQNVKSISTQIVRWNPQKSEYFCSALSNHLGYHPHNSINMESLTNCILKSINDCDMVNTKIMSNMYVSGGPRWFDEKCLKYKKNTRRALRDFRNSKPGTEMHTQNRNRYLDLRRSYDNLLAAKRKKFMLCIQSKLINSRNASDFYRALSTFRPRFTSLSFIEHVKPSEFYEFF
jgi:hypothetical protein